MALLFIHAHNSAFHSCDDGAEYDRPEVALALGVQGAVALLADEVTRGERNAAIEISIERPDGMQVLRSVIALSVSTLLPVVQLARPDLAPTEHDQA